MCGELGSRWGGAKHSLANPLHCTVEEAGGQEQGKFQSHYDKIAEDNFEFVQQDDEISGEEHYAERTQKVIIKHFHHHHHHHHHQHWRFLS